MTSSFWSIFRLRYSLIGTLVVVSPLFLSAPALAQDNSAIAQEFQSRDPGIATAALVSVEKDSPNFVELSDASRVDRLAGVVTSTPLIELSEGGTGVQVVISGTTSALVSDLGGDIATGDKITASPISGVGMKAMAGTVIVGTAQASLNSVSTETREITDNAGRKQQVKIGIVPVQVSVAFYSPDTEKPSGFVPPFLQNVANSVAGKNVSPMRVLIAALILFLLFLSITILLYSSVRSSIISIGRNPLSETAVRKSLFQVGITVVAVLIFTVALVYLVLTV